MPTVLIVDDQFLVRQGLKQVLSEEFRGIIVGEAQSAGEALAQIKKGPWNLIVLKITLPDKDGFQVLQEIRTSRPATRVLMLSDREDHLHAMRSLKMGAAGYVTKSAGRTELVKTFKNVMEGKQSFAGSILKDSIETGAANHPALSEREHKVLMAFAAGQRVSEIAAELNLSIKTISTYKRRILNKLLLGSTADLVRHVIENQLR